MPAFLFPFVSQELSSDRNGWNDNGQVEKISAKKFGGLGTRTRPGVPMNT
jgi:hypothetical protein